MVVFGKLLLYRLLLHLRRCLSELPAPAVADYHHEQHQNPRRFPHRTLDALVSSLFNGDAECSCFRSSWVRFTYLRVIAIEL